MPEKLTDREESVLQSIIHHYILSAKPVGSRVIAKKYGLGLSAATIRNVMADLEDAGFLSHPHTSAGRIPTSNGYRIYVDSMMKVEKLTSLVKRKIRENVQSVDKNYDFLLAKTSQILGMISSQLGVVIGPALDEAIFDKLSLVQVSNDKLLAVLTLRAGIIKSVVVEVRLPIKNIELEETCQVINERLSGLMVKAIRASIGQRLHDINYGNPEIIRLFIESAHTFFHFDEKKIFIGGTKNIVEKPEYNAQDKLRSIIELIEEKEVVIHLLSSSSKDDGIAITIGDDSSSDLSKTFSIVSTKFELGGHTGTLGIIGPTRMWYPKMVPLVDYAAEIINQGMY
ncbi:heat-inducible transcription repressor HrcA [candidate division KSB1 bacterium]|nr:heat-inducible transcription repressor HrcA [candidate division KSB1 bacterium]